MVADNSSRSVHSLGSKSAWESVVGHDDPTVPINNCKEVETPDIPDSATIDSFITQPEEIRDVDDTVKEIEQLQISERKGLRDQLNELDRTEQDWQDGVSQPESTNDKLTAHKDSHKMVDGPNVTLNPSSRSVRFQFPDIHSIDENEELDAETRQPPSRSEASEKSIKSTTTIEIVRQVQKRLCKNDNVTPNRDIWEDTFK